MDQRSRPHTDLGGAERVREVERDNPQWLTHSAFIDGHRKNDTALLRKENGPKVPSLTSPGHVPMSGGASQAWASSERTPRR